MSQQILVTGGAGFLGSHLCDSLCSSGHDVVCLDNLGSGRADNLTEVKAHESFTFVEGDVREPLGDQLPDGTAITQIYHLASRASPADFEAFPVDIAMTNGFGTRNVLEFAREVDARVLYTSTSEVYGDPEIHPQPESYNGNVNIRGPRACYDESKRFGETLVEAYTNRYGLDTRTARLFNTYGPRMRPDDGRVISTFLRQALQGDDLTVYGDGTQTRSFLYVDDQIRGLRSLMETPALDGEVINIGSTEEITIRSLAERVRATVGTDVDIVYEALPEDDPKRRQPAIEKAQQLLDWSPTVDLEEGLERTSSWVSTQLL